MAKVDLTEGEVYSRLRSVSNSKENGIYDALRSSDIPWDFSSPLTLLRVVRTEAELTPLVFTGDAETVNFMKEVAEVEEGKRCDCCGQLITTPLWDMPYDGICPMVRCVMNAASALPNRFTASTKRLGKK